MDVPGEVSGGNSATVVGAARDGSGSSVAAQICAQPCALMAKHHICDILMSQQSASVKPPGKSGSGTGSSARGGDDDPDESTAVLVAALNRIAEAKNTGVGKARWAATLRAAAVDVASVLRTTGLATVVRNTAVEVATARALAGVGSEQVDGSCGAGMDAHSGHHGGDHHRDVSGGATGVGVSAGSRLSTSPIALSPPSNTTAVSQANAASVYGPPLPSESGDSEQLTEVIRARDKWGEHVCSRVARLAVHMRRPLVCLADSGIVGDSGGGGNTADGSTVGGGSDAADGGDGVAVPDPTGGPAGGDVEPPPYPIPITTSQELLELLASIGSPNRVTHLPGMSTAAVACWGMIQLQLKTPGVPDLRRMFADMHPHHRQTGLDDALSGCEWFAAHRMSLGEAALVDGYVPLLQQFAKRGVPPTLRRAVWAAVLGVGGGGASGQRSATARRRASARGPDVSDVPGWVGMPPSAVAPLTAKERALVESLLRDWREVSFVTDAIVAEDVRQTCNDECYFPFEDMISDITAAFFRDPWVLENAAVHPHRAVTAVDGDSAHGSEPLAVVPPCGVTPFDGVALYAAPLCFMYHDPSRAYLIFRAMWVRHWCKLNTVSTKSDTLLPLCKLFEDLIRRYAPKVVFHMARLGVQPLRIAFPWIRFAFVGLLEVDELFQLWDRVIGFDRLEILAVLAAAVFVFRSRALLEAHSEDEMQDVFRESSRLRVAPLLQYFLFAESPA